MESFLKKIAYFIFIYHKSIVVLFSLLTVLSIITSFNMEIKTDIIDVLPTNNKNVNQFKEFLQKFSAMDNLIIVVKSKTKPIDEQTNLIEDLAKKLSESALIKYVDSSPFKFKNDYLLRHFPVFLNEEGLKQIYKRLAPEGIKRQVSQNRQKLISPFSSPLEYELIARDPLNMREIIMKNLKKSNKNDRLDLSTGYYFTKDHSMAFIFVKPTGKSRDMAFVKKLKKELDKISLSSLKDFNTPGAEIGFTGSYAISEEVRGVIKHDIISSSSLSVVLIALLIWLIYRVRVTVLLIIGFVLMSSLAMTLAFAYMIFGSLNIVTSIVAAVLIGLYVDYPIHMIKRYGDELRLKNNPRRALEVIISKTGPAIILSGVTTSLSFFTILVTRFEGLYELGIVCGTGVILCLLSSLFLMSSLLILATKDGAQNILSKKEISSGVESLTKVVVTKPKYIILFNVCLLVFASIGISKLGFNNDTEHLGVKASQAIALGKEMNKKIGGKGEPLNIVVKGKDAEELTAEFDSLERTLYEWERDGIIGRYDSLGTFLPAPSTQALIINRLKELNKSNVLQIDEIEKTLAAEYTKNNFVYEKHYIHAYLAGIIKALRNYKGIGLDDVEALTDQKISHFYNKFDLSIVSYIYPSGMDWSKQSLARVQTYIEASKPDWILTGKAILFKEIKTSIINGTILASILGLLLNLIVIYWYFKKPFHVLMVMLPVVLGFPLTLGIMGYINAPLNFINVGTIALIFGFGVDYGIYLMQAYLKEEKKDIGNALQITGKNIMMGAATTIAGCGSLVTAKFIGIATIGLALSIGAISCAFIALVVLPTLLYIINAKKI